VLLSGWEKAGGKNARGERVETCDDQADGDAYRGNLHGEDGATLKPGKKIIWAQGSHTWKESLKEKTPCLLLLPAGYRLGRSKWPPEGTSKRTQKQESGIKYRWNQSFPLFYPSYRSGQSDYGGGVTRIFSGLDTLPSWGSKSLLRRVTGLRGRGKGNSGKNHPSYKASKGGLRRGWNEKGTSEE